MDLTPNNATKFLTRQETEQLKQEKQEYFLLGTFVRNRSLKLFGYNHKEEFPDDIFELKIEHGNTVYLVEKDNKLVPYDPLVEKCTVDSRFIYFESLNFENARRRVNNYKSGKIKTLCNLKKPNNEGINFF